MRPNRLIPLLCFLTAALGGSRDASAQEGGTPGIQVAPAVRWPTRAPFGTTIRCPFSYVPDGDTVNCWGSGSVGLVMLEGPRWAEYYSYSVSYYSYVRYVRHGCYGASVYRRAYLRGA